MRRIITTIAAACFLLGACSSGGDADSTSTPAPTVASPSPTAVDLAAVAAQAGCIDWEPSAQSDLELFVAEGGHCTLPSGGTVTLHQFVDEAARGNYWDAASAFGADRAMTVEVGLVTLATDEADDLAVIRATLAGSPAPTVSASASDTPTADPDAFIAAFEEQSGLPVDDDLAADLIETGQKICTLLEEGNSPADLADAITDSLGDNAPILVGVASQYLCPED